MGGFRLEPKQYNLIFEDPKFDGLRVSLTGMSMQQTIDFDTVRFSPVQSVEDITGRSKKLAEIISSHVIEWNLSEEDGSPTPQTAEGLMGHDPEVQHTIVANYARALQGVPESLGKESTTGVEVDSIPMENLPPNL